MKILVTGGREWTNVERVLEVLSTYEPGTTLVHGACRGADLICAAVGEALGFVIKPYPADWVRYPRAAGPIRNQQMIDEEIDIDLCLAFHDDITSSKGTADMIRRAKIAGIPCKVHTSYPRSSEE